MLSGGGPAPSSNPTSRADDRIRSASASRHRLTNGLGIAMTRSPAARAAATPCGVSATAAA